MELLITHSSVNVKRYHKIATFSILSHHGNIIHLRGSASSLLVGFYASPMLYCLSCPALGFYRWFLVCSSDPQEKALMSDLLRKDFCSNVMTSIRPNSFYPLFSDRYHHTARNISVCLELWSHEFRKLECREVYIQHNSA